MASGEQDLQVVWDARLKPRGEGIKKSLDQRKGVRRGRRSRQMGDRAARFANRRPSRALPPSIPSRVDPIFHLAKRLCRFAPVTSIAVEVLRFERQRMENSEMTGIAYQEATLFGDDVRESLLEKWKSAYCGARDVRREIDPILPKSLGGTVRVSPLVICCQSCHQKKGKLTLCLFLKDPGKVDQILCLSKKRLKEATAVNGSRKVVGEALVSLGKKRIFGVEPRQNAIE